MITQIYGVESFEEAEIISELGIDYIGVVVGLKNGNPGVLGIKQAIGVLRGIKGNVKKIVLPFTENIEDIIAISRATNPDILHVACEPDLILPNDIKYLKNQLPNIGIMRTIPVTGEESVDLAKKYDGIADYLLLDTKNKDTNQLGITGQTHDWGISRKIVQTVSIPVILAGGIGPENVAQAISVVKPFGVDSKTKTDKKGSIGKDIEKVRKFLKIAKSSN